MIFHQSHIVLYVPTSTLGKPTLILIFAFIESILLIGSKSANLISMLDFWEEIQLRMFFSIEEARPKK